MTGYNVYRGTSTGAETLLTTVGNVTGWTDNSVVNGVTYYYKVSALNSVGEGALSNERSATPVGGDGAGRAVVGFGFGGQRFGGVAWTAPSSNGGAAVTGYDVYRGTSSGAETLLTTVGNVTGYTDGSVSNGTTYYYKVSALNSVGEGAQSNERSATPAAAATVPGAPSLGSASGANGTVGLAWSAPASDGGAAVSGYRVYRGTSSGGETLLTTLGNVTGWTDSSVVNGTTYYYKVSALNSVGEGALSNERSATPVATATVPGAPSLLSASAGNGSVALTWSAPASDGGAPVGGYRVYRSVVAGDPFPRLMATVGNVTGWTDGSVVNGTTYYYKVSAVNSVGEGASSNERSATPAAAATVPGAPSLVSASAGSGSVTLAWSAPGSDGGAAVSGYRVYRGTSSGAETLLTTLGTVTGWTDSLVVNGVTYYYKVSAVNSVGEGALSNERSATPVAAATVPGAPSLGSASAGNGTVALGWSAPGSDGGAAVTGYNVYRGTASGAETLLTTVGNVTGWTDSSVVNGATYYYKVSALNSVGEGAPSNERSATPVTVPGAPSLGSASAGSGSVALSWTAPSSNGGSAVTGYRVYRGTSSGAETLLTTLGNVTGYTDGSASNGTTYYYKVSAVNSVGEGALSNERSATPAAAATVPGAPSLVSAAAGSGSVTLAWSAPSSDGGAAVSGYRVYRGTSSGGETLVTTLGNVTGWTDGSVANGTTYYYKVSALNSVGEGALSNERGATPVTVPSAPTLISASAGSGSVALLWTAPSSNGGSAVTGYRVYRGTSSGAETLLTTLANVTGWTDSSVANGTTYYYKVSAVNSVGEGPLSGELSARPAASATVPGAPNLVSATAGTGSIGLGWTAPTSNGGAAITGYRIYRGTRSGGETLLATVGNLTSYTDRAAAKNTVYYYKVSAVNSVGEGPLSNERSAKHTK